MNSLKYIFIFAFLLLFLPAVSFAAVPDKLAKEYLSDIRESGIGVAMQPPEGWLIDEYTGVVEFADGDSAITIGAFTGGTEGWSEVQKAFNSYKKGETVNGYFILSKGSMKMLGKPALYTETTRGKIRSKNIVFMNQGLVYTITVQAEQSKWQEHQAIFNKSVATFRFLDNGAIAAKIPKKLGQKYTMTGGKYGFDFSIQVPEGWQSDTSNPLEAAFVDSSGVAAAILLSREVDQDGEWKNASKVFGILSEKQLKELFSEFASEWEDATILKIKSKEKINGGSNGVSMEFTTEAAGKTLYGKVILFGADGYIYNAGMVTTQGKDHWKKYKSILEKSVKTIRLID